jgi:hypothetical protein
MYPLGVRLATAMCVTALLASCDAGEVDLEGRACPCVPGWICDVASDRCVPAIPGSDAAGMDAARGDAGPRIDAGRVDSGPTDGGPRPVDGGEPPVDGGPVDGGPPPLDPPWWDTAWGYRARITIENAASVDAPAAMPVRITVDLSALPSDPVRSRVRVVRWDGDTRTWSVVDYATDPFVAAVTDDPIWFPLAEVVTAGARDTSCWLYWDNPAADDVRRNRIFTLFDSFYDPPDSAWYTEPPFRMSTTGNTLILERGASIRSATRFGPGYAVDVQMTVPTFSAYFWAGFQRETDFVDGEPWIIWINRNGDLNRFWPEVKISAIGHASSLEGTHLTLGTAEHIYTVERHLDEAVFSRDYTEVSVIDFGADYTNPLQVRVRSSPESGPEMLVDLIRVRPVIRPMPVLTLGSAEARP